VLEGATLGGQIIDRHLRQSLGIEPATGGAFFHGYGAQVGPMWNRFREVVTDFATSDERQRAIVQSAQATFRSFDDWLAQRLVALP
jgi:heme oxygenase